MAKTKKVRRAAVSADGGLNLRCGPGLDVIETLPDGTELTLVDIPAEAAVEEWCPVITDGGAHGWVMEMYLRRLED